MRKRILKKSDVLHEGYVQGLRKAQRIINEQITENQTDDDKEDLQTIVGDMQEELNRLLAAYEDGNYHRSGAGFIWDSLNRKLDAIRSICNRRFGRGAFRR